MQKQEDEVLDLLALFLAYSEVQMEVKAEQGQQVCLLMKNQARILCDDGEVKSFDEKLQSPDLQDMLEQTYLRGRAMGLAPKGHDPGRFRLKAFFSAV